MSYLAELKSPTSTSTSTSNVVILPSNIADAPTFHLKLQHAICLPCRSRGSRCEGHNNYTVQCIQCAKRGSECAWQLKRKRTTGGRTKKRKRETTDDGEEDEEEEAINDGEDNEAQKVKAEKAKERNLKPVVPSARWPARYGVHPAHANIPSKVKQEAVKTEDVKGKGRAKEEAETDTGDSASSSQDDDNTASEDEENNATTEDIKEDLASDALGKEEAIVKDTLTRLQTSDKGHDFLTLQSYSSLLNSIFAEDSSNLASSLYWWEDPTSTARSYVRDRWPDPSKYSAEEWQKLQYLDRSLVENAHSWSLWPRNARHSDDMEGHSTSSMSRGKAIDKDPNMPEEIAAIVLRQLQQSGHIEQILGSLGPLHMESMISSHISSNLPPYAYTRKRSAPHLPNAAMQMEKEQLVRGSLFNKKQYAVPPLTSEEYALQYLDKDDLLLDHVDEIRAPLIRTTLQNLDEILLKIAEFRRPEGMRRHMAYNREGTSGGSAEKMSEKKKGKQKAFNQDAPEAEQEGRAVQDGSRSDDDRDEEQANKAHLSVSDNDTQSVPPARKKKRRREHQQPADWKAVLLAAACVEGMPRSALEATMRRLEAMYGSLEIDRKSRPTFTQGVPTNSRAELIVMKRYDAMHPHTAASSPSSSLATRTTLYAPKRMVGVPALSKGRDRSSQPRKGEASERVKAEEKAPEE